MKNLWGIVSKICRIIFTRIVKSIHGGEGVEFFVENW